jgi:hypothetical protein
MPSKSNQNTSDAEVYELTPKGAIMSQDISEDRAIDLLDGLELYMRRAGYNAMTFEEGGWKFIKVEHTN